LIKYDTFCKVDKNPSFGLNQIDVLSKRGRKHRKGAEKLVKMEEGKKNTKRR